MKSLSGERLFELTLRPSNFAGQAQAAEIAEALEFQRQAVG